MKTLKQPSLDEILKQIQIPEHNIPNIPVMSWTGLSDKQRKAVIASVAFWLEQDLKDSTLHPIAESYLKAKLEELEKC